MVSPLMLQGTASHVGKSILTTALCRIFKQDGYKVAPFKAQNMALNSYVTKDGGEMGRAQAVQAEACDIEPRVEMNPVLLKPTGNASSQVIVLGEPVGNFSAFQYHQNFNTTVLETIANSYQQLSAEYDIIVLEGAGSPAEVNLKERDIVNMRMAKLAKSPVVLIADIDKGGALASIVGTLELLPRDEQDMIKGFIINKFRGDIKLLQPALDFLETKTGKPVLGVIPFLDEVGIADEDSVVRESDNPRKNNSLGYIDVVIISLPKLSNFSDFDCFENEEDVKKRYIKRAEDLGDPDLIIIPGSKNIMEDIFFLKESGLADKIIAAAQKSTPIVGIGSGYQMLGVELHDPFSVESTEKQVSGLGLLPIKTTFTAKKITRQITGTIQLNNSKLLYNCANMIISGYQIHTGEIQLIRSADKPNLLATVQDDGFIASNGLVLGTHIHGIFDEDEFRHQFFNNIRRLKGWEMKTSTNISFAQRKIQAYDRLAAHVREYLAMDKIYRIIGLNNGR